MAGLLADHLRVHRAGVDDRPVPLRGVHVHLGDERDRLVGLGVQIRREALPLGRHVRVGAQDLELLTQRRLGGLVADGDRGQRIDPIRCVVLQRELAVLVEQDVDDDALGRSQDHVVDELLVLDVAAVAADELHPRARQRDLEHPRVGGVGQVQAHHLAASRGQREIRLTADQQHVTEAAHGRVGRLGSAERRDLAVFEQDVVEREHDLAVHGRPVVGVGRLDEHVAVQAHLLAVVLADVRVIPVQPRIGERDAGGEPLADRHRPLRLVRSVVAVLQAQSVPMDGGVHVALVLDVDHDLRALPHLQRRSGDRPVVGQHPDRGVAQALGDRSDPQVIAVTVGQLDKLGRARLGKPSRVCRELVGGFGLGVLLHQSASLFVCAAWGTRGDLRNGCS